ncbi:hypothetical protein FACS1894170_12920 [Planctomycetales bacterium]|nr:hypothetical protein FACS1894170_12920 [Planctomycetales bacterium]
MFRSVCFVAAITVLLASASSAVEQPLLGHSFQWTGGAGGKSAIKVVSQNPLIAEVSVGGGAEGFPGLKLALPKEADWRRFGKICCEVKLESDDPGLKSGGKEFALCLYDNELRHQVLDGHPHVQQVFARLKVREGDWQEVVVDLTEAVRGKTAYFDIALYDMPYNYPHKYKVSFRHLRLVGGEPNQTVFDKVSYPARSLKGEAGNKIGTINTADGLAMALTQNGGILNVSTGGKSVGDGYRRISGILLRDAKTDSPPMMAGGIVQEENEGFRQIAELKELNLTLNAAYRAEKNRLLIDGRVDSTNNEDRAVTVYVAVPILDGPWHWHQSISRFLLPFAEMKAFPQFEDSLSRYPLAVLSDPKNNRGIGLILDQGQPVVYRFGINPREKLLYVAFDFALLNQENYQGKSQRGADFHLEIVRTDPAWGFRSGVEKLYALHPEHFVDRVGFGNKYQ